jgi:hypothetical protein
MGSFVDYAGVQSRSIECLEAVELADVVDMERCCHCGENIPYWINFCFACGRPINDEVAAQSEQIPDCEDSFHEELGESMAFCPGCGFCLYPAVWRRTICEGSSCLTYDLFRLTQLVAKVTINPHQMEIVVIAPFSIKRLWRDVRDVRNMFENTRRLLLSSRDKFLQLEQDQYQFVLPAKPSFEGELFAEFDADSDELLVKA